MKKNIGPVLEIHCLIDNRLDPQGREGLYGEHGLSFFLQEGERSLLFDTGQSGLFLKNAKLLGLHPERVEEIVISHGHYDHANGLVELMSGPLSSRRLWLGAGFFEPKWACDAAGERYIGPSWDMATASMHGFRPTIVSGDCSEIFPGYYLLRNFSREHQHMRAVARLQVLRAGTRTVDHFDDEIALVLRREEGLIVLVGCAHPGLINMLASIRERLGQKIYAVLGGSHLVEADGASIEETIRFLLREDISLCALGHCSGEPALSRFRASLPSYTPLWSGSTYRFPGLP